MIYRIQKLHANELGVYEENKCAPRSYFISYGDRATLERQSVLTERANSDKVTLLSGAWRFKYYEKISRMPTHIDTDKMTFDTVQVPATWQRTGYEPPVYLNTRYEFDPDPPKIPEEMSCGVYAKTFTVKDSMSATAKDPTTRRSFRSTV